MNLNITNKTNQPMDVTLTVNADIAVLKFNLIKAYCEMENAVCQEVMDMIRKESVSALQYLETEESALKEMTRARDATWNKMSEVQEQVIALREENRKLAAALTQHHCDRCSDDCKHFITRRIDESPEAMERNRIESQKRFEALGASWAAEYERRVLAAMGEPSTGTYAAAVVAGRGLDHLNTCRAGHGLSPMTQDAFDAICALSNTNDLLEQAYDAEKAGDVEKARELRERAGR